MHNVYAIALYLGLLKLDRLVDDISQDMPLFRQDDPHSYRGCPSPTFHALQRVEGGGGSACTPVSLKCLLLLKMQYRLSEDFFNLPLTAINSLLIQLRCTTMRIFQCIWLSANPLMSAANDCVWFVLLL